MASQRGDARSSERREINAVEIVLLASSTACAKVAPPWGRERARELIDALLALATQHGFAQRDALRSLLVSAIRTERTQLLAQVAFSAVPEPAVLDVVRASGFYSAGLYVPSGH